MLGPQIEAFGPPPGAAEELLPCAQVELGRHIGRLPCRADHRRLAVRMLRGAVRVEASAPGRLPAAGSACIQQAPGLAPARALAILLRCLGRLGLAGSLAASGRLEAIELRPALPALQAGEYLVEIGNGVGVPASLPLAVRPSAPAVVSAPALIGSFIGHGSCPPPEQTIRLGGRGHDRVRVTYENPDGDIARVSTREAPHCPAETIDFSAVFDRIGMLMVAPARGGMGGAVRRIPVTSSFGSGAVSSASLFAFDPGDQGRAVRIARLEGAPGLAPGLQGGLDAGSLAEGRTRSVPLARCTLIWLRGLHEAVKDPASETGGMNPPIPRWSVPVSGIPTRRRRCRPTMSDRSPTSSGAAGSSPRTRRTRGTAARRRIAGRARAGLQARGERGRRNGAHSA